jgi:hypothetical protein
MDNNGLDLQKRETQRCILTAENGERPGTCSRRPLRASGWPSTWNRWGTR